MGTRRSRIALIVWLAAVACSGRGNGSGTRGQVVGVADGDTITVLVISGSEKRSVKVRLHGVDCPERAQPYGKRAKQLTAELVFERTVQVVPAGDGEDRYGRTLGKVRVDGKDLGEELLRAGLAWHYVRYDDSAHYARLELEAREAKRGLWADPDPVPPWEWRRSKREQRQAPSSSAALPDAPYHGNVKSMVLHAPTCEHYHCKNCTARFGTLRAAVVSGYRPHTCIEQP